MKTLPKLLCITALSLVCAGCFSEQGSSVAFAQGKSVSKQPTPQVNDLDSDDDEKSPGAMPKSSKVRPTKEIAEAVLKKAFGLKDATNRVRLGEKIHAQLNKTNFAAAEEGVLFAALAVLHAQESSTKLAAAPFLTHARKQWPGLADSKEAPAFWSVFAKAFDEGSLLDDTARVQAALALAGSALENAEDTAFHFYEGLGLYQMKKYREALLAFGKVAVDRSEYRRAKYLEALIHVESSKWDEAKQAFQIVVAMDKSSAESASPLPNSSVSRLRELGVLNLARLAYEQGEFLEALAYYRTLMQDSPFFHESLSEQGWAFFLAGFPNRALGAQYAAVSPFFSNRFNPDAYFLGAVLHYWMCDFESARIGLAKFVAHTKNEGDELRKRVSSWSALPEADVLQRYAKLYDDALAGVSARNIGLGPKTLAALLEKDAPKDAHIALVSTTNARIKMTKTIAKRQGADRVLKSVTALERELKLALGRRTQAFLGAIDADFEKSLSQARLLYLEILTAKKDALLGKERSVKGQEFTGVEKQFEEAFGNADTQKWAQDKNEFWFDELGHYVFQSASQCGPGTEGSGSSSQGP
ncbi:MAG: hypothetical protein IOD12_11245 [Silvanigrellales bacterium]|nr:hypothetical protein [Silvanigrellales bacterium]